MNEEMKMIEALSIVTGVDVVSYEENCGTVWFKDEDTSYYLMIVEDEGGGE